VYSSSYCNLIIVRFSSLTLYKVWSSMKSEAYSVVTNGSLRLIDSVLYHGEDVLCVLLLVVMYILLKFSCVYCCSCLVFILVSCLVFIVEHYCVYWCSCLLCNVVKCLVCIVEVVLCILLLHVLCVLLKMCVLLSSYMYLFIMCALLFLL